MGSRGHCPGWLRVGLGFGLLLCVATAPTFAQTYRLSRVDFDHSAFPDLHASFDLHAAQGEPIVDPAQFSLEIVETSTRKPVAAMPVVQAAAWVLAVDVSGSMKPLLPDLKEALAQMVEGLGSRDRVGLVAIHDRADVLEPVTADLARVAASLRALEITGSRTELFAGIDQGLTLLEEPGLPERRVLLLISDGKDERRSTWTLDDGVQKALAMEALVVAVGTAWPDDTGLLDMARLAEKCRGVMLRFDVGDSWQAKVEVARRHVASRWEVRWVSELPLDGEAHTIQMVAGVGQSRDTWTHELKTPYREPVESEEALAARLADEKRRRSMLWGGAAAGGLVLALLVWWIGRSLARRRSQLARLEDALGEERARHQRDQQQIESMLEAAKAKLEGIEEQVTSPAARVQGAAGEAAAPITAVAKRRTVFQPGAAPLGAGTAPSYQVAWLDVMTGQLAGSRLQLPRERTTLGRDDDCQVVLDEDRVSLHHAAIEPRQGSWIVEDLGSTNGTYLGEARLDRPTPLVDGSVLRIGGVEMRFRGVT